MGGVDIADQYRAAYDRKTRQYRTWIPLFMWLFHVVLVNAAILWQAARPLSKQRSQTLHFRNQIAKGLLRGRRAGGPEGGHEVPREATSGSQNNTQILCVGPSLIGWNDSKPCTLCKAAGRRASKVTKTRQFGEISNSDLNSRQQASRQGRYQAIHRAPRTRYGCKTCQVAVCDNYTCWEEHRTSSSSR
jgi:hypothetical protein